MWGITSRAPTGLMEVNADVLYYIAEFLSPHPLGFMRLSEVSRVFREVFTSDRLWKYLDPYNHQTDIYAQFLKSHDLKSIKQYWTEPPQLCSSPDLNAILGAIVTLGSKYAGVVVGLPANEHLFWCAVHINGLALDFAPPELLLNRDLRRAAILNEFQTMLFLFQDFNVEEALLFIKTYETHHENCPPGYYKVIPPALRDDFDVAMAMVKVCGASYYIIGDALKNNREIVLEAVKTNGTIVTDTNFLNDREIVLKALETDYTVLYEALDFRDDTEMVHHAIKLNSQAFLYASPRLRADPDTVMLAVSKSGTTLAYASRKIQDNELVVRAAVANNRMALEHASPRLQNLLG